ncbi:MAG: ParB/RepB/Spo0J family partition protein [Eubacteriales bacterium]|nr:ParB/RepB/Spo0J family partition protein [Eubacteriales bacterium]
MKSSAKKEGKSALGKGIGALLGNIDVPDEFIKESHESVIELAVGDINPNHEQPRKSFDDESLAELAQSIRENGIIQPLIVTKISENNYQLVAGERRWRAARLAELAKVPVIVRELSDEKILEHALIENIQREDLNPIETAEALKQLIERHDLTQTELAERVGKSRSALANTMRLLKLPEEIREEIIMGELSEGHGRAILALEDPEEMILVKEKILAESLSVRETEALVQELLNPVVEEAKPKAEESEDKSLRKLTIKRIETILREEYGTRVSISDRGGKGVIKLHYQSNEDLERLLNLMTPDAEV